MERTSPLGGRRPKRDELAAFNDRAIDNVFSPNTKLLIIGINPGLWTAAVNAPFAAPGNRFWPSLAMAGLTPYRVDAAAGLLPADLQMLAERGISITNLVNRATARADELTNDELRESVAWVSQAAELTRPKAIAILGVTAYRVAFDDKKAKLGQQFDPDGAPKLINGARLWVLPQPSGLNAHAQVSDLAQWWRQLAPAAGIQLSQAGDPPSE